MVTIKEIADMLGISTTTVSNVIHGKTKKVSAENVLKIKRALKEYNYIPRMGLNALRGSSSHMIGITIHSDKQFRDTILADPFYGHIVGALEEEIRHAGYYTMLYTAENVEDIFVMASTWNVDGLIAITFTQNDYNKLSSLVDKPIVAIDLIDYKPDMPSFNVGLDDRDGGYQMTTYLIHQGFRKIFLLANRNFGVDHERFLGYRAALEEAAIPYRKEWFVLLDQSMSQRMETYHLLLKFIKKNVALFFLSDLYALEAISCFLDHNVHIPAEISIAGFDDIFYTNIITPKLTTVRQDITQKAVTATRMLMQLLHGETVKSQSLLLPITLKIRNTVGQVPPTTSEKIP